MLPCLPNLSSSVVEYREPWELSFELPNLLTEKDYKNWATQPDTKYCAYSPYLGEDPYLRVTGFEAGNPPTKLYGFVADYDAQLDEKEYEEFIRRSLQTDYPVNYVSRSFSGGLHALWLFEEPLLCPPAKSHKAFIERLIKELKLKQLARGLDEPAAKAANKYFLLGFGWKKVSENYLPPNLLSLWQYETTKSDEFNNFGVEIDLSIIEKEVRERFPNRWEGPFQIGSRGVRFWDSTATNKTAAVVRSTGMQCFTGPQPFVTWGEIFGRKFVQKHQADKLGAVIEGFYYDGREFWQKKEDGELRSMSRQDFWLYLKVTARLNPTKGKGAQASELEEAANMVINNKRVGMVAPFVYHYDKIFKYRNNWVANSSLVVPHAPSEKPVAWKENFPHIGNWLEGMLGEEQLTYFLSWLHHAYKNAYDGAPKTGQALFIVGKPDSGKTLLTTNILAKVFGGHTPASQFLQGKTQFNDHLFESGLWTVDDEVPSKEHTIFTSRIKEYTVNHDFTLNAKFRKSGQLSWKGRIAVTMNDDVRSVQMLPDMDMSVRDKLMVFQVKKDAPSLTQEDLESLSGELAYFCRYVYDYQIPDELRNLRFGVEAYFPNHLLTQMIMTGRNSVFFEMLELFRYYRFSDGAGDEDYWEGTASDFLTFMGNQPGTTLILRDLNSRKMGWGLRHLYDAGCEGLECIDKGNMLFWRITNLQHK